MTKQIENPLITNIGVQPEGYISKEETAKRMGKTVRTIDNYMRTGVLPYYKMGRTVAFRWSEVEAHLAANYRVCLRTK